MKSTLFALLLLASVNASACPGGNFKLLKAGDVEIGQVNMMESSIQITDSRFQLVRASLRGAESTVNICGLNAPMTCDSRDQLIAETTDNEVTAIRLVDVPSSILTLTVARQADEDTTVTLEFEVSNFRVTRSFGSCGEVVQPVSGN